MATVHLTAADAAPADCRDGAVAVGNFDGVHRGHAALIAACEKRPTRSAGRPSPSRSTRTRLPCSHRTGYNRC